MGCSHSVGTGREPPVSKKALLVGLNYTGTRAELRGCINDVKRLKTVLTRRFKYSTTKVNVLTDLNLNRFKNVQHVLKDFINTPTDIMVFHYSGHGTQTKDYNKDEDDGYDEALYTKHGILLKDDTINSYVRSLPETTKILMIFDACHSGSVVDLPWQVKDDGEVYKISDQEIKADVVCITGCRDNQVSMDVKSGLTNYGAMSNDLTKLLKEVQPNTTWKELVYMLRKLLVQGKYAQVPQLSASKKELFDQNIFI